MTKLAVALDTVNRSEFLKVFHSLSELPLIFKVGLKMLPRLDANDWKVFNKKELFVDAKLHDIPSQVADAVVAYGDLGANYLTVHLSGGRKMLEEAVKAAQPYDLRILGVSILTSLSTGDLGDLGFGESSESVERLLKIGIASGLDSFVMSVHEVTASKKLFPHIYCVTPGISFSDKEAAADQSRVAVLSDAVKLGPDMIVMGRAILKEHDPKAAAQKALKMLG